MPEISNSPSEASNPEKKRIRYGWEIVIGPDGFKTQFVIPASQISETQKTKMAGVLNEDQAGKATNS